MRTTEKILIAFIFIFSPLLLHAHGLEDGKYMVEDGDTLPFKLDTNIEDGDTSYLGSCHTFIVKSGKIINQREECVRKGYWEIENDDGTISKGRYKYGDRSGVWKTYDKEGDLKRVLEYAVVTDDEQYVLKEVVYKDGKKKVLKDNTLFAKVYYRNVIPIMLTILFGVFLRVPLNWVIIYKNYGETPKFWIPGVTSGEEAIRYMIWSVFTFWWRGLNEESKWWGRVSNSLSVISVGGFFVVLIGLAVSGEIG